MFLFSRHFSIFPPFFLIFAPIFNFPAISVEACTFCPTSQKEASVWRENRRVHWQRQKRSCIKFLDFALKAVLFKGRNFAPAL
jgi:hypothetical protein